MRRLPPSVLAYQRLVLAKRRCQTARYRTRAGGGSCRMIAGAWPGVAALSIQENISPPADRPLRLAILNPARRHSAAVSALPISGRPSFSSWVSCPVSDVARAPQPRQRKLTCIRYQDLLAARRPVIERDSAWIDLIAD